MALSSLDRIGSWRPTQIRDVQGDAQEDSGHTAVAADRGPGQLRPGAERVLLRPAPGGVCAGAQLLPVSIQRTHFRVVSVVNRL